MNQLVLLPEPEPIAVVQIPEPIAPVRLVGPRAAPSIALDSLRLIADDAARDHEGEKRPSWGPALALEGEIVVHLRELGWLTGGKDVARLWARYTSPVKGPPRCIGFELRAGQTRAGRRIFETLRQDSGEWVSGPRWIEPTPPSTYGRYDDERAEKSEAALRDVLVRHQLDHSNAAGAAKLAAYEAHDRVLSEMGARRWDTREQIHKAHERYERERTHYMHASRAAELGAARVAEFAGQPAEQMKIGGVLTGKCSCCGKALTDPISLERGIGPDCWAKKEWIRKLFEAAARKAVPS